MLTIVEASEALRVSERTVRRHIQAGRLQFVRVTPGPYGAIRIRPEAIQDFLDANIGIRSDDDHCQMAG